MASTDATAVTLCGTGASSHEARNGKPTLREIELGRAKRAGYDDDAKAYVRIYVERRVTSGPALRAAWAQGARLRASGWQEPAENAIFRPRGQE